MKRKTLLILILVVLLTVQAAFAGASLERAWTTRFSGKDRFETALSIYKEINAFYGGKSILVSGRNFPDALSGVVLTYESNSPILLSEKNSIPYINEDFFVDSYFYVLGGKGVISEKVEDLIYNGGGETERIGGKDRYETSVMIAEKVMLSSNSRDVIIVSGNSFPDSLSASNLSKFRFGAPIILVNKNKIPKVTKDFLNKFSIDNVYIVGGKGVVSNSVEEELKGYCNKVTRLSGKNRYLTNLAVIDYVGGIESLYEEYRYIVIATGKDFPDALAAGIFTSFGDLIMLVGSDLNDEQREVLESAESFESCVIVVGGKGAVSEKIQYEATNYLNCREKNYILADGTELTAKIGTKEDSRDRILANINSYRAENGLAPLEYEYSWLPACNLRAVETMVTPSPYRPDGSYFDTAFVGDTVEMDKPVVEDTIIIGEGTHGLFASLKSNEETNSHMLNPNFTKIMFCGVIDKNVFGFRFVLVYR